jgi:putative ABC transport system permease protein
MTFERLPISTLGLAWRQAWRDFRAGELRLLMVAVVLAVAALTAVGFFADRLDGALARDARQLLGGDAVVASDQPAAPTFAARAAELGLQVSTNVGFPSMARADDARGGGVKLAAIKAVSATYPLRGLLRVQAGPGAAAEQVRHGPPVGAVWADASLLDALGLAVGDALWLGERRFVVDRVLLLEPDRGAGFMVFAPRVMLHADDLPATRLVQPASRVTYRLAVAAPDDASRVARVRRGGPLPRSSGVRCARRACRVARDPGGPRCARRWTAPRRS